MMRTVPTCALRLALRHNSYHFHIGNVDGLQGPNCQWNFSPVSHNAQIRPVVPRTSANHSALALLQINQRRFYSRQNLSEENEEEQEENKRKEERKEEKFCNEQTEFNLYGPMIAILLRYLLGRVRPLTHWPAGDTDNNFSQSTSVSTAHNLISSQSSVWLVNSLWRWSYRKAVGFRPNSSSVRFVLPADSQSLTAGNSGVVFERPNSVSAELQTKQRWSPNRRNVRFNSKTGSSLAESTKSVGSRHSSDGRTKSSACKSSACKSAACKSAACKSAACKSAACSPAVFYVDELFRSYQSKVDILGQASSVSNKSNSSRLNRTVEAKHLDNLEQLLRLSGLASIADTSTKSLDEKVADLYSFMDGIKRETKREAARKR